MPTGRYLYVSAGYDHSCGLRAGGGVVCWGDNDHGQTKVPSRNFSHVGAGFGHSCGVEDRLGAIICWGHNGYGQADAPDGRFSQISLGGFHTCGLRINGAVVCWGDNALGQTEVPPGRFSRVSAGGDHSCGLRAGGGVVCWGLNDGGQTDVPAGLFSDVSAGGRHSCGLRTDGRVVCWGSNFSDQTESPTSHFIRVSSGYFHSCGLDGHGEARCWGDNYFHNIHVSGQEIATGTSIQQLEDGKQQIEAVSGRIVARRLVDGRTEFGFQPEGNDRILPRPRLFPVNAEVGRWLHSGSVSIDGREIGRINARLLADGRIEFALLPIDGERILPKSRLFPADANVDRWLRSSVIYVTP